MRKTKIVNVYNPYFSPDFIQKGDKIEIFKTGTWWCSWVERTIKGFKATEEFKKLPFKTKEEALKYESKLLLLFNK